MATGQRVDGLRLQPVTPEIELALLHRLLGHQVVHWGQLRTLMDQGGGGIAAIDEHQFERIEAAARAVEAACCAWRTRRTWS